MKQAKYEFFKQPGSDGINLNDENQKLAEVASTNGYVESFGFDNDDERESNCSRPWHGDWLSSDGEAAFGEFAYGFNGGFAVEARGAGNGSVAGMDLGAPV